MNKLQRSGSTQWLIQSQIPENEVGHPESNSQAIQLGQFKDAVHFNDGLFSSIYKATVPENMQAAPSGCLIAGSIVALKVIRSSMATAPHNPTREARLLRAIHCSNVIPLLHSFSLAGHRGYLVLVLPFLPFDLQQLSQQGMLSTDQARTFSRDVLSGLSHIHSLGIIHRDIKPSNILLKTVSGPACLADFGIAWSEHDPESEPADSKITDVGTTCYRPPELLFGWAKYGCSLDIWAAGCVIAEMTNKSRQTLFDAGELGSELALIQSIFQSLGTPDLDVWPVCHVMTVSSHRSHKD